MSLKTESLLAARSALMNSDREGILFVSQAGIIVEANKKVFELSGLKSRDILNRSVVEVSRKLFTAEDLQRAVLLAKKLLAGQAIPSLEFSLNDKILEIAILPRTSDLHLYLVYIQDVTAKKGMQEQLIRAERVTASGQLASGIAHEFNNILAIIKGNVQLAEMENTLAPAVAEYFSVITRQIERAQKIVSQLLAFARPGKLQKARMDLRSIIDEVISLQEKQLVLEHIIIEREYPSVPVIAEVDRSQLQQVFLNLFFNARHAIIPHGQGRIEISIRFDKARIRIDFHDNGTGMDRETKRRIFTPFFTTKGAFSKDKLGIYGIGLGLSVCHTIILNHQGRITFNTEQGKGTVFSIFLPLSAYPLKSEKSVSPLEKRTQPRTIGGILVVDDETELLAMFGRMLNKLGYQDLSFASSGKAALELLSENSFDVVFLDMLLPDMEGEEILRSIRKSGSDSHVFFLSGKLPMDRGRIKALGADGFVHKPFEMIEIKETLNLLSAEKGTVR
jgi:PAS domain S-box-containing protein